MPTQTTSQTPPALVAKDAYRDGMAYLPGAVNIVTTNGPGGRAGFTATAVCSVTDDPPTLLVCLNKSSSASQIFSQNVALCVNTIGGEHTDLAMDFGGKRPPHERFDKGAWRVADSGAPILQNAAISFDCRVSSRLPVGTHDVIFCEVLNVHRSESPSVSVYFSRNFIDLEA